MLIFVSSYLYVKYYFSIKPNAHTDIDEKFIFTLLVRKG